MAERWEYKIVYITAEKWTSSGLPDDLNQHFDQYGAEGWELVNTESIIRSGFFAPRANTVGLVGFFKRRVGG